MNVARIKSMLGQSGPGEDARTSTLWTTPWVARSGADVYVGHDGAVWLYGMLPLAPTSWEDDDVRLALGSRLQQLLRELGATSKAGAGALRSLSQNREIHLVSITYELPAVPPPGTPEALARYQMSALGFLVPHRTLLIGVKLRADSSLVLGKAAKKGVKGIITGLLEAALAEDMPDLQPYEKDRRLIGSIIARAGGKTPSDEAADQLESWYNKGRGPDATIIEGASSLSVAGQEIEMTALMRFDNAVMSAPTDQWVAELLAHSDAPFVVSVRGQLEPSNVTRNRARRSQRRTNAAIEEELSTGDLERAELTQTFQLAKAVEDLLVEGGEPVLTNTSIVMAAHVSDADETYVDYLREKWGIRVKPLEHRQVAALEETLPTSPRRVNPFLQDVTLPMLAYCGVHSSSDLGDRKGAYLGLVDPFLTPCFLDLLAAPAADSSPAMAILGSPGSGKTFASQSLALQAVLSGTTTIFINPKGHDTLASFAELAAELGMPSRVVKMSALQDEPGAFDPFRYAPPEIAADIAFTHITSVLSFTQEQSLELATALRRAAAVGVTSVGQALDQVIDSSVVTQIRQMAEAFPLFALAIGTREQEPLGAASGLTLIEFDRKLDLPDPGKDPSSYTMYERNALAAIRLVARASMEILAASGGGAFFLDEAWTFLGHPAGMAALTQMGREGRSLNILPVFITQNVADILSKDLEAYLSRVIALQLNDDRERRAALKLVGLEATPARLSWLSNCGPKRDDNGETVQWAMGLHRDLKGRHAALLLGPVPPQAAEAFSTNPEDRERRRLAAEREAEELRRREADALTAAGIAAATMVANMTVGPVPGNSSASPFAPMQDEPEAAPDPSGEESAAGQSGVTPLPGAVTLPPTQDPPLADLF